MVTTTFNKGKMKLYFTLVYNEIVRCFLRVMSINSKGKSFVYENGLVSDGQAKEHLKQLAASGIMLKRPGIIIWFFQNGSVFYA